LSKVLIIDDNEQICKLLTKSFKKIADEISCALTLLDGLEKLLMGCFDLVSTAARNTLLVMVTGRTGTGKELFARAIHENSDRHKKEFVVVDCAALPEHLVESILFGHVKGAFTGADSNNTGLLTLADGGTLFLDEIGELPLNV